MPEASARLLEDYARLIVRVGLNLQPGQNLLIAEPYELHGVSREAESLVKHVAAQARAAGSGSVEVIWADESAVRQAFERNDQSGFERRVAGSIRRLEESLAARDALLFLESSQPALLARVPADRLVAWRARAWESFGAVAASLVCGATAWLVAPAPTDAWADAAFADLPRGARLGALWSALAAACRLAEPDPLAAWDRHLEDLTARCADLNARRLAGLRLRGRGTDLVVALPPGHRWCTAVMTTPAGRRFVANLPTEEIFTVPHRDSAEGVLRAAGPVVHGGGVIDGLELEFRGGRVVRAAARVGGALLDRLLAIDAGAGRLGEVALVPVNTALRRAERSFLHPVLDENARNHVALGQAYPFTRPGTARSRLAAGFNDSLLHLDLPVEADVELIVAA